jgi:hypothetical protein
VNKNAPKGATFPYEIDEDHTSHAEKQAPSSSAMRDVHQATPVPSSLVHSPLFDKIFLNS